MKCAHFFNRSDRPPNHRGHNLDEPDDVELNTLVSCGEAFNHDHHEHNMLTVLVGASAVLAYALPDEFPLWPDVAPGEPGPDWPGPEVHKPAGSSDPDHIWNVSVPTLTPFIVKNSTSGAAVVIAPGGGYAALAWKKEGTDVARFLNSIGVSAFVLKYRIPLRPPLSNGDDEQSHDPRWAWAQLQDAQRAVGLVRYLSDQYGLNTQRIGFMGFSAGGHLTAMTISQWANRTYTPVSPADRLSCRPDVGILLYPWRLLWPREKNSTTLAPEVAVSDATPPAFFGHAADDPTAFVTNSIVAFSSLLTVGAPPGELHVYPTGGHGFGLCKRPDTAVCSWPAAAHAWLAQLRWARSLAPSA
eukprot:TRINITY_DN8816_c0_g1_i1.p1 TRINITY_DN8816_c0_g1~~TRINITY_DN8816_c0_g1_i1.p1  ORF type:complete len:357 (-),score=36.01 TRINITY_DN8816_c0_g1_i1:281-1351(-)